MAKILQSPQFAYTVSAFCFCQIVLGGPDPTLSEWPQLYYTLQGVQRTRPIHICPSSLPITPEVLTQLQPVKHIQHMHVTWASVASSAQGSLHTPP